MSGPLLWINYGGCSNYLKNVLGPQTSFWDTVLPPGRMLLLGLKVPGISRKGLWTLVNLANADDADLIYVD
jgi:hypothetical protein